MQNVIAIAIGGAVGALLRYSIGMVALNLWPTGRFPIGTLMANLLGAFMIGFLWHWFETFTISSALRALLLTGMLGALTTFSTFALEGVTLYRAGYEEIALVYVMLTNTVGLAFVLLGLAVSRSYLS